MVHIYLSKVSFSHTNPHNFKVVFCFWVWEFQVVHMHVTCLLGVTSYKTQLCAKFLFPIQTLIISKLSIKKLKKDIAFWGSGIINRLNICFFIVQSDKYCVCLFLVLFVQLQRIGEYYGCLTYQYAMPMPRLKKHLLFLKNLKMKDSITLCVRTILLNCPLSACTGVFFPK